MLGAAGWIFAYFQAIARISKFAPPSANDSYFDGGRDSPSTLHRFNIYGSHGCRAHNARRKDDQYYGERTPWLMAKRNAYRPWRVGKELKWWEISCGTGRGHVDAPSSSIQKYAHLCIASGSDPGQSSVALLPRFSHFFALAQHAKHGRWESANGCICLNLSLVLFSICKKGILHFAIYWRSIPWLLFRFQ